LDLKEFQKKKVYIYRTYSRWLEEKGQRYVKINAEKKSKKLDTFVFFCDLLTLVIKHKKAISKQVEKPEERSLIQA